jgi:cysteine dioxygenase
VLVTKKISGILLCSFVKPHRLVRTLLFIMENLAVSPTKLERVLQQLAMLTKPLAQDEMGEYLRILADCHTELTDSERFCKAVYQRNLVFSSEHLELLLLCWLPGQRTPLHDHTGSICGVQVLKGCATEIRFKYSRCGTLIPDRSFEVPAGGTTVSRDADVHMIANLSADNQNLVTLHCYSPRLENMKLYDQRETIFSDYDTLLHSIVPREAG